MAENTNKNLNYFFNLNFNFSNKNKFSIEQFKKKQVEHKIEIYEKNLNFYYSLEFNHDNNYKFSNENYNMFFEQNKKLYKTSKIKSSFEKISRELNKIKTYESIKIVKKALKKDFVNYITILKKELKQYNFRYRYCDKCGASYPTFLKHSRHCFNCKINTSIKKGYDIELKKELNRFYENTHKRNKIIQKINQISILTENNY